MLRVIADHAHHTLAVDDLALIAELFYCRPDFHDSLGTTRCQPVDAAG